MQLIIEQGNYGMYPFVETEGHLRWIFQNGRHKQWFEYRIIIDYNDTIMVVQVLFYIVLHKQH